jgi:hypothetical protein
VSRRLTDFNTPGFSLETRVSFFLPAGRSRSRYMGGCHWGRLLIRGGSCSRMMLQGRLSSNLLPPHVPPACFADVCDAKKKHLYVWHEDQWATSTCAEDNRWGGYMQQQLSVPGPKDARPRPGSRWACLFERSIATEVVPGLGSASQPAVRTSFQQHT